MKKTLVVISLAVAGLVTSASALNIFDVNKQVVVYNKTSLLKKLGCTYYNMQPEKIRELNYCPTKENDITTTAHAIATIRGAAQALEYMFGSFSTNTQKVAGGTGISINTDYKTWLYNYRSFVCSLNDKQLQAFSIFTKYVDQKNGGVVAYKVLKNQLPKNFFKTAHDIKKFERINNYLFYAMSISKDKKIKNIADMAETTEGGTFLIRLFFKHKFNYTSDPAIAKFVGAIARGDYKKAWQAIATDKRVIEGYNAFNALCKK